MICYIYEYNRKTGIRAAALRNRKGESGKLKPKMLKLKERNILYKVKRDIAAACLGDKWAATSQHCAAALPITSYI